ncbi:MAG: PorT family protein [Chitinophagaceae bacterium]|mgnify:CR=1 FL=1|nr:PorT family protein [Chitinophagaceae bacterium]MBK7559294.1 PorT family protein [Chitinophagaceae bacterium]MBK9532072.1 PorT family protein [Chitinophagaceae bacterium]
MKKVFLGLFLTTAVALGTKAQVYVQGGLNLANISKTKDGQTEKNNILPSFNVGVMGRLPITSMFSLESGLLLTGKGSKAETYFNGGNDYVKTKFNPLYLEIPVNAVVKIPLEKESNVFFHAGPYVAVGIGGKSRQESKFGPLMASSTSNIKFSNDDPFTSQEEDAGYDRLKRFDVGLNFGGGVQFGRIMLKANYGLGLTKINSTESNNNADEKNKYRTLSFSVGIPLGK